MADITSRYQGNVSDEGQQGPWRESVAPIGGQSMYDTSSVQLAELGHRKVVGDRVFRYALAGGTVGAGLIAARPAVDSKHMKVLPLTNAITGVKAITLTLTTSAAANYFADGYLHVASGTAAEQGYMYKIKTHASIGDAGTGVFTLYDPIKFAVASAALVSVFPSPYSKVVAVTDQTGPAVGIAPIAVVSGDYFWLQTWGPSPYVAGSAGVPKAGGWLVVGSAGMAETTNSATCAIIGIAVNEVAALEYGHGWLTIAP